MNYKKPFYSLRLKSNNAGYRLSVNGCLIEEHNSLQPNQMEYPINHWLKNGTNTFDIYHLNVPTGFGKLGLRADGEVTFELCVRENDQVEAIVIQKTIYLGATLNLDENRVDYADVDALLSTLKSSTLPCQFNIIDEQITHDESGAFIIGEYQVKKGITKALHISQKITLPAPFPLWRFFEADELTNHLDLTDEEWEITRKNMVEVVYQPLWQALKDNNATALKSIFSGRGKEFDQAFYKPNEGQDTYEMVHHLTGLITDQDLSDVRPLDIEDCDVYVTFNNKLAWLHNWDKTLSSVVDFKHKEADLVTRIPVMFARFDGKWEIVR